MPDDSQADEHRYLTGKEAAARLRVSDRHLRTLRKESKGPRFADIDGRILYDVQDIDAWVEARKRGGDVS